MGFVDGVAGAALLAVALGSEGLAVQYGYLAADFDEALFASAPDKATFWGTFTEPCVPYLRYIYYEIARASLVHAGAFLLLGGLRGGWAPLRSAWNRSTLSRGVMNVCFLAACGYRGAVMWNSSAAASAARRRCPRKPFAKRTRLGCTSGTKGTGRPIFRGL